MKHFKTTALLLVLSTCLLTVACSKEEVKPAFPETQVVGTWRIPLNLPSDVFSSAGQRLIFSDDHTVNFSGHLFEKWIIDGRDIICSNYVIANGSREVDVMKFTINGLNDSVMIAEIMYTHSIDNHIDKTCDLSGIYTRIKEDNQANQ